MCPVFFLIKFNIILYIWLFILKYKSVVVPFSFAFAFAKFFGGGCRVRGGGLQDVPYIHMQVGINTIMQTF